MLKIYKIIKSIQSKSSSSKNISVMLAIQMSLDYIESENPEIIEVLRHLALCPSGLNDHHLKSLSQDWENWVDLLKDRSLITEKKILEED